MFYAIRHFTRYRYSKPVSQSSMEVRMHPRSEYSQRCFTFQLSVSPRARVFSYYDHTGNVIHHFDIPEPHRQLRHSRWSPTQSRTNPRQQKTTPS